MLMTAEQALEQIRPDLARIVAAKEQRLGSRMRAYEALGSKLGRSPTWIRKVLGRAPDVTVGLHDALNIRAAYERLCARIEGAAESLEGGNQELRRELDAALGGDRAVVARAARAPATAEAASRGARGAAAPSPVPKAPAAARVRAPAGADLTDLPLWRAAEPRP